jgi:hypothetical protein
MPPFKSRQTKRHALGIYRIMQSADRGKFWVERYWYRPFISGVPTPRLWGRVSAEVSSEGEALHAMKLLIKGPQVIGFYSPEGEPA